MSLSTTKTDAKLVSIIPRKHEIKWMIFSLLKNWPSIVLQAYVKSVQCIKTDQSGYRARWRRKWNKDIQQRQMINQTDGKQTRIYWRTDL